YQLQQQQNAESAIERCESRLARVECLTEWKKENEAIKEQNKVKKVDFENALAAWEEEKMKAKAEKRKPGWNKPKWREDFKPEKLKPRPKKVAEGDDDSESSEESGDEPAD
ncbi:hypothetical protein F5878DRAFT_647798, partial [Lentinula raphanica]